MNKYLITGKNRDNYYKEQYIYFCVAVWAGGLVGMGDSLTSHLHVFPISNLGSHSRENTAVRIFFLT